MKLNLVFFLFWAGLSALTLLHDWSIGWTVFFSFAAGERWAELAHATGDAIERRIGRAA